MYRKATAKDCEKVYRLICGMEGKKLPYEKFRAIFQEQIDDPRYYCLVYEQDAAPAGILNLRFEPQLHHAEYIAEIMEFVVDPAYRGGGIGKGLFENACQIAREQGCTQIEAACNQLRLQTHRFYIREGMHNFHFKFSKSLVGNDTPENAIGK